MYRTPTANGANANWQHTVIIEGEGSRADISTVSIQVFDEVLYSHCQSITEEPFSGSAKVAPG